MAKKKTLESFNNGCKFEEYLKLTNFKVRREDLHNMQDTKKSMNDIMNNGYKFFKKYQAEHGKRSKPGFLSKLFNTKYNKLYKAEEKHLDAMRGDLYKLGVPNNILSPNHKENHNDKFEILSGTSNAIDGISLENKSMIVERWNNGIVGMTGLDGKEINFTPKEINAYNKNIEEVNDPTVTVTIENEEMNNLYSNNDELISGDIENQQEKVK